MIYDNKLHKKLKTFLQHLSPRWGSFKKISPAGGGVFEQKFGGPEDIPGGGGGMVTDTDQDDTCIR